MKIHNKQEILVLVLRQVLLEFVCKTMEDWKKMMKHYGAGHAPSCSVGWRAWNAKKYTKLEMMVNKHFYLSLWNRFYCCCVGRGVAVGESRTRSHCVSFDHVAHDWIGNIVHLSFTKSLWWATWNFIIPRPCISFHHAQEKAVAFTGWSNDDVSISSHNMC